MGAKKGRERKPRSMGGEEAHQAHDTLPVVADKEEIVKGGK